MMKGIFLVALLSFTMYQCDMVRGQICGCGVRHPQVRYCNANFTAMIEVHDSVESTLPFTDPNQYGFKTHLRYNISIMEVFKPMDMEMYLVTEGPVDLWTSIGAGFCGKTDLEDLETYIVSGDFESVTDPATGEVHKILVIDTCDIYLKEEEVSIYQMEGLKGGYDLYCGKKCQPNDAYGTQEHKQPHSLTETRLLPIQALTKFWSLSPGCFYNPVGSKHNVYDDCESKFSVCRSDPETQECTWEQNPEFLKCFRDRGLAVTAHKSLSAAAIRRPSDCKYLHSRKLKRDCMKKLKKYHKQRLQRKAAEALQA